MSDEKNTKPPAVLSIGAFRYDRAKGELRDGGGNIVHIRKQSADVLGVLAARADEVVEKGEIIDAVWPGVATTDDSLVQCIADIRRTLGHNVVETFPKKGYRLRPGGLAKEPEPRRGRTRGFRLRLAAAGLAAGAAALLAAVLLLPGGGQAIVPPDVIPGKTLAVLPFANLGADAELRYFSDGLSEDLTTDLSKVPDLTVISTASSFDFRDAESGFRQIAGDLGVRFLVRGTVRHQGDRVRINVSLIDPFDGFNLWSDRFDRRIGNTFDVQEEVTLRVVEALSLTLSAEASPAQRIEPDAYFMLLRGLDGLRLGTAEGNLEARGYFARAVRLDPGYARGYASLARTYGREAELGAPGQVSRSSVENGLQAAITAIQLDPGIPHAYHALGVLNLAIREHDHALSAARHAIRLNGNYSDGYALLAEAALYGGDLGEALAAIQRAKLLHPHHPSSYDRIEGQILFQEGRYDEAQPFLESAVEASPRSCPNLIALAANYGRQGQTDLAAALAVRVRAIKPNLDLASEPTPYRFDDRRDRVAEGLHLAGLMPR